MLWGASGTYRIITIIAFLVLIGGCVRTASNVREEKPVAGAATAAPERVRAVRENREVLDRSAEIEPVPDLWARIRRGFSLADAARPEVQREIERFVQSPATIERIVEQARPYLYQIAEEIERHACPMELALLPAIESGFRPAVRSPAGMVGLWQFAPDTARRFNLRTNRWFDQRRDVIASTRAALRYLKMLHGGFNQDWLLALAGYNCGGYCLKKSLERHSGLAGVWQLDLPRHTRQHIARLLALAAIVADPKRYGIKLDFIPDKPLLATAPVDKPVPLAVVADLTGVSEKRLRTYNPGLIGTTTHPEGQHLHLPVALVDKFVQDLRRVDAAPVTTLAYEQTIEYQVTQGDSLWLIARKFGVRVADLKIWNELGETLQPGQTLKIQVPYKESAKQALTHPG